MRSFMVSSCSKCLLTRRKTHEKGSDLSHSKEKKPSASMKLISKKLHQELTTSLDNKEVAVEAGVTTTGMTTPGPAATEETCMAAAVGVSNPWVMEAGDPMAGAPGAAVRCNAGGAGAEAVVDLIEGFLHFFLFFLKKIIFLKKSIP